MASTEIHSTEGGGVESSEKCKRFHMGVGLAGCGAGWMRGRVARMAPLGVPCEWAVPQLGSISYSASAALKMLRIHSGTVLMLAFAAASRGARVV